MAKRYTDSNKWDDPWYSDLPVNFKLTWDYICGKCDAVGVWKPSKKHLEFNIGMPVDMVAFLKACGPERIVIINSGNWWLKKFCDFQYGELKEDSKSPTTQSYIKMLKKHNLWEGYIKGIDRLCNSPKEKEKDTEEEKEEFKIESPQTDIHDVVDDPRETIDNKINAALDEIYIEQQRMKWAHVDFGIELFGFIEKVRGSPDHYANHDTSGLRLAFQAQLRHAKKKPANGKSFNKNDRSEQNLNDLAIIMQHASGGSDAER